MPDALLPPRQIIKAASPLDFDLARQLFRAYAQSLDFNLDFQDFDRELAELPGIYSAPAGVILLALDLASGTNGKALGTVALRPMAEYEVCEMKRLYVVPSARKSGTGRALVQTLLDLAAKQGYRRMRLDTLQRMPDAIRLYRDFGFYDIPPYCDNPLPDVVYLECRLSSRL